jgi:CRP/FNR family transcriptional regulator
MRLGLGLGKGSSKLLARAGDHLFTAGDSCAGFMRIHSGRLKVIMGAENGREVVLYRVGPGEVCLQSFTCLNSGIPYCGEGFAETDIWGEVLSKVEYAHRISSDAAFRDELFGALSNRLTEYESLIEDVALVDFDTRLARVLLRQMDEEGCVRATHAALATEAATGRAVISRRLSGFSDAGLVWIGRGEIQVRDMEGLSRLARIEARAHHGQKPLRDPTLRPVSAAE